MRCELLLGHTEKKIGKQCRNKARYTVRCDGGKLTMWVCHKCYLHGKDRAVHSEILQVAP